MPKRTFGWVQEAYTIPNLKKVIQLFDPDSDINAALRLDKIPRLIAEEYGRDEMLDLLGQCPIEVPYPLLKGKGSPKGYTRSNAPCSGIVQAVLPGQRKEYQSDWPADSYLRWAVSIGFLAYDRDQDSCRLTPLGKEFASAEDYSFQEEALLTHALLSYPPVCRILNLLDRNGPMTKFEIGCQLGFVGEAGFTSVPQRMILQGLAEASTDQERNQLLQDVEGTADKYVRTICSWLKSMCWIVQRPKVVEITLANGTCRTEKIPQSYELLLNGRRVLKSANGTSKFPAIPKRVMWDMLATKAPDRDYLRSRRAHILSYLSGGYRTLPDVVRFLTKQGLQETEAAVLDDIRGFINIGLRINHRGKTYQAMDDMVGLEIPCVEIPADKSTPTEQKERIRPLLKHIDHKYLALIDLGFDGALDRDYEILTADLLVNELGFRGGHLGGSRKPDVAVFYGEDGLILDNKAYRTGYSLPIKQADEMYRYLEENQTRDKAINPNQWWKIFDPKVTKFRFAFVSGAFTGGFQDRLDNLHSRSGLFGAAISSAGLLLLAEEVKSGRMTPKEFFAQFDCNGEIKPL